MPLRALASYARRPERRTGPRCDLCGATIGEAHRHLVDLEERSLRCACQACALLFHRPGLRYRAVPDRYLHDPTFVLDEAVWSGLQLPVRIAFFFRHSTLDRWVAFYPGPAGATESLLDLDAWQELAAVCPLVRVAEADVEALLVAGDGHGAFRCYLVPIHACYELVGRVKRTWRGFDGGEEAWREIDGFFARVQARSDALTPKEQP
jgi:Family of unknown function (DUF5947)